MFANWLAVVFYTQTSLLAYNYNLNNNEINKNWLYAVGFLALATHFWIITSYNITNQVTAYSVISSIAGYILLITATKSRIPLIIFPLTALIMILEAFFNNHQNIYIAAHLIAASVLLSSLIFAAIIGMNIFSQNKKLKMGKNPNTDIPALEVMEKKFYNTVKVALAFTFLLALTSVNTIYSIKFSPELLINLALTLITTTILVLITKTKNRNLVKSQNSILIIMSLILFAIIFATCLLLRK